MIAVDSIGRWRRVNIGVTDWQKAASPLTPAEEAVLAVHLSLNGHPFVTLHPTGRNSVHIEDQWLLVDDVDGALTAMRSFWQLTDDDSVNGMTMIELGILAHLTFEQHRHRFNYALPSAQSYWTQLMRPR